ncbi:MAG: CPBP family intramembrane glutamic endopeptidase [Brevinematia bacterium]
MVSGKRKVVILLRLLGLKVALKIISLLGKKEREILKTAQRTEVNIKEIEKIKVLKEFISYMNYYKSVRKANLELYFKFFILVLTTVIVVAILFFKNSFYELQKIIFELSKFLAIGGGYLFILPFLFLYTRNKTGKGLFEYYYTSENFLRDIFVGVVASVFVFILLSIINLEVTFKSELSGLYKELYIIVLVFLAPFCEEILFRGIAYEFLEKKLNKQLAVIGSALLFTLVHIPQNAGEAGVYFLISLILGGLRYFTSNLLSSTIAHSIGNIGIYFLT